MNITERIMAMPRFLKLPFLIFFFYEIWHYPSLLALFSFIF
ncbi:hypothetical protein HMPREF1552_00602 [Leptotrichia sp. oral taxon 879 str. F0557]|nr:hypothetical protein HMPREF1552_00602 [Leptotrichia sp. oral taxon 879 str. F0557]